MGDWKKHVVPDWVVDNYNSRVSEDTKLPIGSSHDEFNDIGNSSYHGYYSDIRNQYEREHKYSDISEDFMCKFAMFYGYFYHLSF